MKFDEVLKGVEYKIIQGNTNIDIDNITANSRKAGGKSVFVCITGFTTDGHKYIESANKLGCSVFVCERAVESLPEGATVVRVENSRIALSKMAANLFGNPSTKFNLIGITGTNGKTSSTYFMEEILKAYKHRVAVVGTVEIRIDGVKKDVHLATSTTPDTIELNELFCEMAEDKVDDVVIEVSSHSLELNKVDGMDFDTAIFTNLTQDHLDLHKTMENYCQAKARLFKMCRHGIINADDKWSDEIIKQASCDITTFGIEKACDVRAVDIEYLMDGVNFKVCVNGEKHDFHLAVAGKFSVYNALGVIAAAIKMGIPMDIIKEGISNIKGVPGRIQNVPNDKGFNVIVDYAHSPDGLDNILKAVREFTKGRVITVFGCGGDRDRKKRPIMGEIAGRLSDYCVVTSDNPRSEEPADILKEIEVGIKPVNVNYVMLVDRREGIYNAIREAKQGDSVVIAGKGHEDYEIFKDKTIHFDDVEVAKEALEEL